MVRQASLVPSSIRGWENVRNGGEVMLNKHNLAVHRFISKEDSRYTIKAIHVTPNETVATDGHSLVRVSTLKDHKAENFPPQRVRVTDQFKPFNLPYEVAAKVEKAILKNRAIPVFNYAALELKEGEPNGNNPTLFVTDMDSTQEFVSKVISDKFPDWEMVIPKKAEATFTITVDPLKLAKLMTEAAKFTKGAYPQGSVKMRFVSDDKAVRLDAENASQTWTGVLMPIRGDDDL